MEGETNQKGVLKIKKTNFYLLAILLILILAVGGYFAYKKLKCKSSGNSGATTTTPSATNNFDQKASQPSASSSSNSSGQTSSGQTSQAQPKDAAGYFAQAQTEVSNKNYSAAIADFQKAIALNPNQEQYYLQESEAQVLAGDKNGAIATVEAGLKALPASSLLQNRLAILQAVVK